MTLKKYGSKYQIETDRFSTTLFIYKLLTSDSGKYTVWVESSYPEDKQNSTVDLIVMTKEQRAVKTDWMIIGGIVVIIVVMYLTLVICEFFQK